MMTKITEKHFWKLVDEIDWKSRPNLDAAKVTLIERYNLEECELLRKILRKYTNILDEAVSPVANKGYWGDDAYGDTLAEVVSRGKDFVDKVVANPMIAVRMYNDDEYGGVAECFSYVFPRHSDFEDLVWSNYVKKLTKYATEAEEDDLWIYNDEIKACVKSTILLLKNSALSRENFEKNQEDLLKSWEFLHKHLRWHWGIKNAITDYRQNKNIIK